MNKKDKIEKDENRGIQVQDQMKKLWWCLCWSDITRTKTTHERACKGHSNIGYKFFVGQTPCAPQP